MALKLDDRQDQDKVYDDKPYVPKKPEAPGDDWDDRFNSPEATDANLPSGHPHNTSRLSSGEIGAAEEEGGKEVVDEASNNEKNAIGGGDAPFNYHQEKGSKTTPEGKGKPKSKKKLFLFALPGIALVLFILILFFLASSLKIHNFAAHLAEFNLLRINRTFADSVTEQTAERFAIDEASNGILGKIKSQYGDFRSATWGKLDAYRPQKVLDNLKANKQLSYNYKEVDRGGLLKGTTRLELEGIQVGEQAVATPDLKFGRYFSNLGKKIDFQLQMQAELEKVLPDTPNIVRNQVVKKIQQDLGVSLKWWQNLAAKYKGMTEDEAFAQQQLDAQQQTSTGATPDTVVPQVQSEAQKAADAEKKALADKTAPELNRATAEALMAAENTAVPDPSLLDKAVLNFSTFRQSIGTAFQDTLAEKAIAVLDPFYQVAFPVCIIYDGSIVPGHSSPAAIDNKSTELQRTFYGVESASDQTKVGDTNAEAYGAMDTKLGDPSNSLVERRARGEPVDTNTYAAGPALPQAGGSGQYTLPDALVSNTFIAGIIKNAGKICPILLSPGGIVGGAALSALIALIPGGGEGEIAAETVAKEAADVAAEGAFKSFVGTITDKISLKALRSFAFKIGKDTATIGSLTILAKLLVLHYSSTQNDGLAVGNDYAEQADMGGNLQGNEINRKLAYGRPMTSPEVALSREADYAYSVKQQAGQGVFQRYFATLNPHSLLNKMGTSLLANVGEWHNAGHLILPRLFGSLGNIFSGSFFMHLLTMPQAHAYAASTQYQQTNNYGIVQWGWSEDETAAIHASDIYDSLYNAEWVAHNQDTIDKVQAKYNKCFTETMGQLLTDGSIIRDSKGNINTDRGDCAPNKLGRNNAEFGDAVFRWRLYNRNNNVLDHLNAVQSPSGI